MSLSKMRKKPQHTFADQIGTCKFFFCTHDHRTINVVVDDQVSPLCRIYKKMFHIFPDLQFLLRNTASIYDIYLVIFGGL